MQTLEFILWSNCQNNCRFCWQRLLDEKDTWLNDKEKLEAIKDCSEMIATHDVECDILLVGGELYSDQGNDVNNALKSLYVQIADKIKSGDVRFLYANTSLTYGNRENLSNLLDAFAGIEDSLKFTTSYDLEGRYDDEIFNKSNCGIDSLTGSQRKQNVLDNLQFINDNYPKVNTVVNTIITRAVSNAVLRPENGEAYNTLWFLDAYPNTVTYVNLIPYIPVEGDTSLDVKFSETVKVLEDANKRLPGYFGHYVTTFDLNQDKLLYEYHRDKGYVERTAASLDCGHNENFERVNRSGECFICKLIEYYNDNRSRLDGLK